jgi:Domain of unknown function (DUF4340)
MNFKTTIVLLVLLAGAGIALWLTRSETSKPDNTATDQTKLVDIDSKDVNKIIVTPSDGPEYTLEKNGADWQITEPVKAGAETFEVDSLVRLFTDAKTRGKVDASAEMSKPHYQVQLVTKDKTVKLSVGDKSAVGDTLYVQVDGNTQADIVGTEIADKLDKGVDPYRKMNLIAAASDQIKQIVITTPGGKMSLEKSGDHWQITQPTQEPVDDSAASDLTFALTGLRADKFVDDSAVPATAMARPQMTVAFTAAAPVVPPATAPSTPATWTTVQFGSYQDILKKNVFATIEGSGAVALLPATSMDSFKKKPLDIRDKKVANIDPDQVSHIVLTTSLPSTTQPTVKPAVNTTVVIERRKINPVLGPALPTTQPAATTQPATAPAAPLSKWVVTAGQNADADDAKVTTLLSALHPLTVDKYLEPLPATQPAAPPNYVLNITTVAPGGSPVVNVITFTDPGHDQPLTGYYNGLRFEVPRTITSNFEGDFAKKP